MTDDLVQRLRRTYLKEYAPTGSMVGDISNRLRPFPILATEVLFNPDGREAADRIETQANTIEELRSANERWVIAFNQAEERANGRIETLREALVNMRQAAAGFALSVRDDNGMPYPWPALDIADEQAEAALQETEQ